MNIEKLIGNTPMIKINYEYDGKIGYIYSQDIISQTETITYLTIDNAQIKIIAII